MSVRLLHIEDFNRIVAAAFERGLVCDHDAATLLGRTLLQANLSAYVETNGLSAEEILNNDDAYRYRPVAAPDRSELHSLLGALVYNAEESSAWRGGEAQRIVRALLTASTVRRPGLTSTVRSAQESLH